MLAALWWRWQPVVPLVPPGLEAPLEAALPQHPLIRVYFNQAHSHRYTDYRGLERYGDDLEAQIVAQLRQARSSVDLAIHELDLPGIALALADCAARGVTVRVIFEHTYNRDFAAVAFSTQLKATDRAAYSRWYHSVDQNGDKRLDYGELQRRDPLTILNNAGIARIDDTAGGTRGSGIMHHKFVVIDGERVVTGSTNFTASDTHGDADDPATLGNVNHLLVIASPAVAALFAEEFALMWGDGPGGAADSRFGRAKPVRPLRTVEVGAGAVGVQFGPDDSTTGINAQIVRAIDRARRTVDFALFVFSSPEIAQALHRAIARGVRVRGTLDPGFADRSYSLGQSFWRAGRCSEANAVGVALIPRGDKLHHKFAVIDGQIVLTGSHNWSAAADARNDESFLIVDSALVAAHFEREFRRLYARTLSRAPAGCRSGVVR